MSFIAHAPQLPLLIEFSSHRVVLEKAVNVSEALEQF